MKWFKHMTECRNGSTMQKIFAEFGLEGEARFWRFLELCAAQWDGKSYPEITISKVLLREQLRFRCWNDTRKILERLANDSFMSFVEYPKHVVFKIPKLLEIKDNHTKNLQVAGKSLASLLPLEEEEEEDKEYPIVPFEEKTGSEEAGKKVVDTKDQLLSEYGVLFEAWGETLKHFGCSSNPLLDRYEIVRCAKRHGVEATKLALIGARFEPKSDRYDPAKFLSVKRVLGPKQFDRMRNLGSQVRSGEDEEGRYE